MKAQIQNPLFWVLLVLLALQILALNMLFSVSKSIGKLEEFKKTCIQNLSRINNKLFGEK